MRQDLSGQHDSRLTENQSLKALPSGISSAESLVSGHQRLLDSFARSIADDKAQVELFNKAIDDYTLALEVSAINPDQGTVTLADCLLELACKWPKTIHINELDQSGPPAFLSEVVETFTHNGFPLHAKALEASVTLIQTISSDEMPLEIPLPVSNETSGIVSTVSANLNAEFQIKTLDVYATHFNSRGENNLTDKFHEQIIEVFNCYSDHIIAAPKEQKFAILEIVLRANWQLLRKAESVDDRKTFLDATLKFLELRSDLADKQAQSRIERATVKISELIGKITNGESPLLPDDWRKLGKIEPPPPKVKAPPSEAKKKEWGQAKLGGKEETKSKKESSAKASLVKSSLNRLDQEYSVTCEKAERLLADLSRQTSVDSKVVEDLVVSASKAIKTAKHLGQPETRWEKLYETVILLRALSLCQRSQIEAFRRTLLAVPQQKGKDDNRKILGLIATRFSEKIINNVSGFKSPSAALSAANLLQILSGMLGSDDNNMIQVATAALHLQKRPQSSKMTPVSARLSSELEQLPLKAAKLAEKSDIKLIFLAIHRDILIDQLERVDQDDYKKSSTRLLINKLKDNFEKSCTELTQELLPEQRQSSAYSLFESISRAQKLVYLPWRQFHSLSHHFSSHLFRSAEILLPLLSNPQVKRHVIEELFHRSANSAAHFKSSEKFAEEEKIWRKAIKLATDHDMSIGHLLYLKSGVYNRLRDNLIVPKILFASIREHIKYGLAHKPHPSIERVTSHLLKSLEKLARNSDQYPLQFAQSAFLSAKFLSKIYITHLNSESSTQFYRKAQRAWRLTLQALEQFNDTSRGRSPDETEKFELMVKEARTLAKEFEIQ